MKQKIKFFFLVLPLICSQKIKSDLTPASLLSTVASFVTKIAGDHTAPGATQNGLYLLAVGTQAFAELAKNHCTRENPEEKENAPEKRTKEETTRTIARTAELEEKIKSLEKRIITAVEQKKATTTRAVELSKEEQEEVEVLVSEMYDYIIDTLIISKKTVVSTLLSSLKEESLKIEESESNLEVFSLE
jgi:hypothetical protein